MAEVYVVLGANLFLLVIGYSEATWLHHVELKFEAKNDNKKRNIARRTMQSWQIETLPEEPQRGTFPHFYCFQAQHLLLKTK